MIGCRVTSSSSQRLRDTAFVARVAGMLPKLLLHTQQRKKKKAKNTNMPSSTHVTGVATPRDHARANQDSPQRNRKDDVAVPDGEVEELVFHSPRCSSPPSSTLPPQLQGLVGLWRSNEIAGNDMRRWFLRDAKEDGLLECQQLRRGYGGICVMKVRLITGSGNNEESRNTVFAVQLENPHDLDMDKSDSIMRRWTANGVTASAKEIVWYHEKNPLSPIKWTRISIPPRDVAAADSMSDRIDSAEQEATKVFQKLRADLDEAERTSKYVFDYLKSEVSGNLLADQVPCCKICVTKPIGVVLLGCGHVLCKECAEKQCIPGKLCWFCKVPYAGRQEMFFS
ncbi:unnamed protein product [Amoebophrya sp. A120]|nr:unnamed protein product [Amoebophrya sp. A120]|eukprot:GSA120T00009516001.1